MSFWLPANNQFQAQPDKDGARNAIQPLTRVAMTAEPLANMSREIS
jgi:hypothetical protein